MMTRETNTHTHKKQKEREEERERFNTNREQRTEKRKRFYFAKFRPFPQKKFEKKYFEHHQILSFSRSKSANYRRISTRIVQSMHNRFLWYSINIAREDILGN